MPPLCIVVICPPEEFERFEPEMEKLKRVVPLKMFVAHKAIDGVSTISRAMQTMGRVHAIFMESRFTAEGKEEYSKTLRKYIKEKLPDLPIVGFGKKMRGEQGKSFSQWLYLERDGMDLNEAAAILRAVGDGKLNGTIQRKSIDSPRAPGRTSLDNNYGSSASNSPRPSIDRRSMDMKYGSLDRSVTPPAQRAVQQPPRTACVPFPDDDDDDYDDSPVDNGASRRSMQMSQGSAQVAGGPMMSGNSVTTNMNGGGFSPRFASMYNTGIPNQGFGMPFNPMMNPAMNPSLNPTISMGLKPDMNPPMNPAATPASMISGIRQFPGGANLMGQMTPQQMQFDALTRQLSGLNMTSQLAMMTPSASNAPTTPSITQPPATVSTASQIVEHTSNSDLINMLASEVARLRSMVESKRSVSPLPASGPMLQTQLSGPLEKSQGSHTTPYLNAGTMSPPSMAHVMPHGLAQAMPRGMPQGMPLGMPQGSAEAVPQGMVHFMPQGLAHAMPHTMPQAMPFMHGGNFGLPH